MKNEDDPKGLIREAYRIDGITLAECRSIFLDWALSLPAEADTTPAIERLSAHYGPDHPDHPDPRGQRTANLSSNLSNHDVSKSTNPSLSYTEI